MAQRARAWLLGLTIGLALGATLGAAGVSRGAFGRGDSADQQALLQFLTEHVTVVQGPVNGLAGPHLMFEGVNVHIRSGSGSTNDGALDETFQPTGIPLTGLGNLIVGYNEKPDAAPLALGERGGSHNLVVGPGHRFGSVGGFVTGQENTASGVYVSVSGGVLNTADALGASVSGGFRNTASGPSASVSGGSQNTASGSFASVGGGARNVASDNSASVGGGQENTASGAAATVGGGSNLTAGTAGCWRAGGLNQGC